MSTIGEQFKTALRARPPPCGMSITVPITGSRDAIAWFHGCAAGSWGRLVFSQSSEATFCPRRPLDACGCSRRNALFAMLMRPFVSMTRTPSARVSNAIRTRSGITAVGSRCCSTLRR